ncbi:hypothetical protein DM01DRAFT_1387214 [Hesseltinella vesiculosa]|uniref:DBF4-type domain-containing protein n=1 Tax=Hesseltinella vesiculosa TaxID=101127 RepID=A0A1X2G2Q0_9FUNG|nr:hypothetical protein DM01DRAFT_1387214 [Hesseltinella vesiculosa]
MALRPRTNKRPLSEVSTNTTGDIDNDLSRITNAYWNMKYRKVFSTFTLYLDHPSTDYVEHFTRKIKLVNASTVRFLSGQCTHVVTNRPFYEDIPSTKEMLAATQDQENIPQDLASTDPAKKHIRAKDPSNQSFFEPREGINVEYWSFGKLRIVMDALLGKNDRKSFMEGEKPRPALKQMLNDEHKYGVNTSQLGRNDKRPYFVPFQGPYILVEDVTQIHKPIVARHYKLPTFDEKIKDQDRVYPWPKIYMKQSDRSPFVPPPELLKKSSKSAADVTACQDDQPVNVDANTQQQQPQPMDLDEPQPSGYNEALPPASIDISSKTGPATTITTNNTTNLDQLNSRPGTTTAPWIKSAPQPAQNGSRAADATPTAGHGVPVDKITDLDRRTISNITKANQIIASSLANADHRQLTAQDKQAILRSISQLQSQKLCTEIQARQLKRKLLEGRKYCENCNKAFDSFAVHHASEEHQAFLRDKNNFKALDAVLKSVQRMPKSA